MDDEVRDRIMPGCLIGTAAASCFFDLVDGERGSRRYQYNSKQNLSRPVKQSMKQLII